MELIRLVVAYLFMRLGCNPWVVYPHCYLHGSKAMRTYGRTGHYCAFCLED